MKQRGKVSKLRSKEFLKHPSGSVFCEGYGQIPKLIMRDKGLHAYAKLIYAYLCSFTGGGNQAFPGISRICGELQIAKNTFYKYMKQLEDAGYIKKIQQVDDFGCYSNNIYELVYVLSESKAKKKSNLLNLDGF